MPTAMASRPRAAAALLAQRKRITNWDEFAATNGVTGWSADQAAAVCEWTGITCQGGQITAL